MAVFADGMTRMRQCLQQASALRHRYQRERWIFDAATPIAPPWLPWSRTWAMQTSEPPGWVTFRQLVTEYAAEESFSGLSADRTRDPHPTSPGSAARPLIPCSSVSDRPTRW